jgi:CheY-like chemotaxis protein
VITVSSKQLLLRDGDGVERVLASNRDITDLKTAAPDVVLCDIGLPEMDGYQVAKAIRADERLRNVRLIALSG